ncbi:UNVERIFIED_CONTAM: hypothetical protein K2H54_052174 [Gekko kuhli]
MLCSSYQQKADGFHVPGVSGPGDPVPEVNPTPCLDVLPLGTDGNPLTSSTPSQSSASDSSPSSTETYVGYPPQPAGVPVQALPLRKTGKEQQGKTATRVFSMARKPVPLEAFGPCVTCSPLGENQASESDSGGRSENRRASKAHDHCSL